MRTVRLARLYRSMGKVAEAKAEFDKTADKAEDEHLLKVMSTFWTRDQNTPANANAPKKH